jgi:hypothetical protein
LTTTQRQARNQIDGLVKKYQAMPKPDRQAINEAGVVHQFLDPLFAALGWPIGDPQHYKYELHTYGGRPDMTLIPETGGTLYVEAKRFGAIKDLQQARRTMAGTITPGQLALPGMATDRTAEEQQAINYAFENDAIWAVLTNFEKLRLFNARRDWLVLSFEWPGAYLDEFDLLWQLSYESVVQGGLDALSNQRHREDVDTSYLEFINGWRERLAQDIIAHPTDNPWAFRPDGRVDLTALRAVVQRILDRLVVVRFAEDHLIAPAGTLQGLYELCKANPYTFTLTEFFQRLYRRFDDHHNSALFAPHLADRAVFGDDVLAALIQKLYEARYRAMSADIMGNTYEQYLGKTLAQIDGGVVTVDNLETRKKQGSYYTPQVIVRYLVDNSLGRYLYATPDGRPPDSSDSPSAEADQPKTAADIRELRVLDPACGSGSFLIYAYQVLAQFYRREIRRLEAEIKERTAELARGGMTPIDLRIELAPLTAELDRLQDYPRLILETHLYGVDLDPQAAEIATVNLIMRAMADRRGGRRRLPLILNQNVKVGNSLVGAGPDDPRYTEHVADLAELRRLRLALAAEEHTAEHDALFAQVDEIAGRVSAVLNAPLADHFADLDAHRPFHWAVEFPEIFLDEDVRHRGEAAGFDVVVGNPPWEIVKPDLREFYAQFDPDIESKLSRREVDRRIAELNAEDPRRERDWLIQKERIEESAAYYHASEDFARQGRGDTATHKLFLERAYRLLEREGRLAFVIPSGIYTDLGTRELRQMLLDKGNIEYLFGLSNERFFFAGVHHAFKFTLLGAQKGVRGDGFMAVFRINPRVAVAPEELLPFLADPANLILIRNKALSQFNPDSLSVLEFKSRKDYQITEAIYDDWPLLGEEIPTQWYIDLAREFDSGTRILNTAGHGLPLYEGKMIHQFDAFYGEPRFFLEEELGRAKLIGTKGTDHGQKLPYQDYRLAHRRITGAVNERSMIACVLPPNVFCTDLAQTVRVLHPYEVTLYIVSAFNSFAIDYILRQKITNHIDMHFVYSLPLPRLTAGNPYFDAIVPRATRLTCTTPEFAALWQEVMGEPWDPSKGATDPVKRQCLRDELDALVAHLYRLTRDDFQHILGTFPLVFPDNEAGHTRKEALLTTYDHFAAQVKDWSRE